MLNDIAPTDIFVTAPPIAMGYMPGSSQADRDDVDNFLQHHAPLANIVWMPDRVFSNYFMVGAAFTVNTANVLGAGTRRVLEMATQMPTLAGRQINANTTFYGGLGPKTPMIDHTVDDDVPRLWATRPLPARQDAGLTGILAFGSRRWVCLGRTPRNRGFVDTSLMPAGTGVLKRIRMLEFQRGILAELTIEHTNRYAISTG